MQQFLVRKVYFKQLFDFLVQTVVIEEIQPLSSKLKVSFNYHFAHEASTWLIIAWGIIM